MAWRVQRGKHKYGAVPQTVDGIRFQSRAEARRYQELRLLEHAGEISELELQPRFPLHAPVKGRSNVYERVGEYRADFRYRSGPFGDLVIEDVKGHPTALYRWKKKHCQIQYGISITEVR